MSLMQNSSVTLRVGDVGVPLTMTIYDQTGNILPLVGCTNLLIKLLYPLGGAKDFTAFFVTDGSNGQIQYTTHSNDLSQAGKYTIQGEVTFPSGRRSSSKDYFWVESNVDNN